MSEINTVNCRCSDGVVVPVDFDILLISQVFREMCENCGVKNQIQGN